MMSWREFYAPWRWTLLFWAWGAAYTIVPNRHIGLDIGRFSGVAEQVPALKSGTVVRVLWTKTMGMVVVLDVGAGRFHAYCHLSGDKVPARGQWIAQGARVGRLAKGPANVPTSHIEFPGTAWGGIHLHLVETNHPDAAYSFPRIKGSEFYNPADTIKALLAAPADGGNARPFVPEPATEEDELMSAESNIIDAVNKHQPKERGTVIIKVGDDYWVVNHGDRTKWNVAVGQANVPDALAFKNFLVDSGLEEYDANKQPPFLAAAVNSYRDLAPAKS